MTDQGLAAERIERSKPLYQIQQVRSMSEKRKIFNLRYEVYVQEMKRDQKHACHVRREICEPEDEFGVILGAFSPDGRAVGSCRINFSDTWEFDYEELYLFQQFEHKYPGRVAFVTKMMVDKNYRRSRMFIDLSKAVYLEVAKRKGAVMVIDCNDHLVKAFRKQGFIAYRDKFLHPIYGDVNPMVLYMDDLEYLKNIGSPFAGLLEKNAISLGSKYEQVRSN